jgi:ABC-type uncharacterized transport system permease subunit
MSIGKTIRERQGVLFVALCGLFIVAAIVLPTNPRHPQPLPFTARILLLTIGLVALTFAVSLCFYFVDSWKKKHSVANKTAYRVWLGLETIVGVPFALLCVQVSLMCLWLVFTR